MKYLPGISQTKSMASQKTIVNFFKPVNKRTLSETQNQNEESLKKAKVNEDSNENVEEKENKSECANTISGPHDDGPSSPNSSNKTTSSLSPEQKSCMAEIRLQSKKTPALHENIGESWYQALKKEFTKPYFLKLSEFMDKERQNSTIYPPAEQVYSWTQYCALEDVKVVILGQDPYHGPKQAHGLCFSVQSGVPAPPSLKNMYKELEDDINGFTIPSHGHLVGWANQGVLLLNAVLTVRAANANSHKDKGWEKFTDAIIKAVSDNNKDVVFILWGGYAQKKASNVDKKKHHLLKGPHPSPLSVYRGFYGCKHFSKSNELLEKAGKKAIDWTHLPESI